MACQCHLLLNPYETNQWNTIPPQCLTGIFIVKDYGDMSNLVIKSSSSSLAFCIDSGQKDEGTWVCREKETQTAESGRIGTEDQKKHNYVYYTPRLNTHKQHVPHSLCQCDRCGKLGDLHWSWMEKKHIYIIYITVKGDYCQIQILSFCIERSTKISAFKCNQW